MPAPSPIAIGQRIGHLVVEALLPERGPRRSRRWLCRCDCGSTAVRTTAALRLAIEARARASCRRCLMAQRARWHEARRSVARTAVRTLWNESGTLWTSDALDTLQAEIREAVGEELGGWRPDLPRTFETCGWEPDPSPDVPMSLQAIAEVLAAEGDVGPDGGPLSRESIRQIEAKALHKLRRAILAGRPTGVDWIDRHRSTPSACPEPKRAAPPPRPPLAPGLPYKERVLASIRDELLRDRVHRRALARSDPA